MSTVTEDEIAKGRPVTAKLRLTGAEKFWYVLGCIAMGAAYFGKIPAKKALADSGEAELSAWQGFWYILMCLPLGAGYFAKVSVAKALTERTLLK